MCRDCGATWWTRACSSASATARNTGGRCPMTEANVELLEIFKALADANRLKIIGLLARQPYSVEQLAALLDLKPPTVSHHLAKLSEVGLVGARAEGYYSMYYLDESALKKTRLLFSQLDLSEAVA